MPDKRFFSPQWTNVRYPINSFFSGVLSCSYLPVTLLLTPSSAVQLSSWDFPSPFSCVALSFFWNACPPLSWFIYSFCWSTSFSNFPRKIRWKVHFKNTFIPENIIILLHRCLIIWVWNIKLKVTPPQFQRHCSFVF